MSLLALSLLQTLSLLAVAQVLESGIKFWVSPNTGQKTGFYADQRDSRLAIRHLSQGKAVLDLCCYTGGFALNALAGGAHHVTGQVAAGPSLSAGPSLFQQRNVLYGSIELLQRPSVHCSHTKGNYFMQCMTGCLAQMLSSHACVKTLGGYVIG